MEKDELYYNMILDFNFYKVREVMNYLDWYWFGDTTAPSVRRMQQTVNKLFNDAYNASLNCGEMWTTATGGFQVTVDANSNYASLKFIVEESNSED